MDLSAYLSKQKKNNLYRSRKVFETAQATLLQYKGEKLLNFCSNDYLGLANDERVVGACKKGLENYGVGSGASQLVSGYGRAHQELEEALADYTGRERVLLFGSGYMANLGVQQALVDHKSCIFLDRLAHASMLDAARLSSRNIKRYQHNDMVSLRQMLVKTRAQNRLIATDSVFSMDGDLASPEELNRLAVEFNSRWLLDDAHGFGVLGKYGKGILEHLGLDGVKPDVYLATFGKALGTFGAFVAADKDIIETMIQKSRSLIYTTAPPQALAYATLVALKVSQEESWRREKLAALISRFQLRANSAGLPVMESRTPIQPLIVGDAKKAVALSEYLQKKNILVGAIRPPTVAKGSSRLRISFSALHTEKQVDLLLDALIDFYE